MSMSGELASGLPQYTDKDKTFLRSDLNEAIKKIDEAISGGGGGTVSSVNGKVGAVVLTGEDISVADDESTSIKNKIDNLETLIDDKQDVITAGQALEFDGDKLDVLVDGDTINLDTDGNLQTNNVAKDVKIDGASILDSNKVAQIPLASNTDMGVIRIATDDEIITGTDEDICINAKQMKDEIDDRIGGDSALASRASALETAISNVYTKSEVDNGLKNKLSNPPSTQITSFANRKALYDDIGNSGVTSRLDYVTFTTASENPDGSSSNRWVIQTFFLNDGSFAIMTAYGRTGNIEYICAGGNGTLPFTGFNNWKKFVVEELETASAGSIPLYKKAGVVTAKIWNVASSSLSSITIPKGYRPPVPGIYLVCSSGGTFMGNVNVSNTGAITYTGTAGNIYTNLTWVTG